MEKSYTEADLREAFKTGFDAHYESADNYTIQEQEDMLVDKIKNRVVLVAGDVIVCMDNKYYGNVLQLTVGNTYVLGKDGSAFYIQDDCDEQFIVYSENFPTSKYNITTRFRLLSDIRDEKLEELLNII